MGGGNVKRLLTASGLAGLLAMIAATAALAQSAPVYCVNGTTTTLPTTVTFAGGSRVLGEGIAGNIISSSFDNSTLYLGFLHSGAGPFFFNPTTTFDPATLLAPGYSTNSVSRGACATGAHVKVAGSSFMCASGYGALSNPDYVAGTSATEDYFAPAFGRHCAFYVQGDLNGVQRAQAAAGSTPTGSSLLKSYAFRGRSAPALRPHALAV